jgi:hypothetical protein
VQETSKPFACYPSLVVFDQSTTYRHHERDRRIDLLIRTAIGYRLPRLSAFDHIANAPGEDRVAIMAPPACTHRGVEFNDGRG